MGAPMSPSLDDLRMFEIIANILDLFPFKEQLALSSTYRDDGFIIFNSSRDNGNELFNIVNNIHSLIQFTHEISHTSIQVFDVTIFRGNRFLNQNILDVKLYHKPTDNFQYLERLSSHSSSVFNGLITAEILRFMMSSNNKDDTPEEVETFKTKILLRGYSEKDINPIITNALHRCDTLFLC
ncbi:unnamed protein product [Mytilus coruscus]|uniref:Reverse transcriptase domain-containing protein n=1 Tax=Mytilus coruscus TaxID=42192 RepID=A0A6J8AN69_MYTCO|nr:unnamed protein product [Mytilus coruscus]